MYRRLIGCIRAATPLVAALVLVSTGPGEARGQTAGDTGEVATVLDGVYTAAQAKEGDAVFNATCTLCHAITEFVYGVHQPATKFTTLGDMFMRISSQMPMDNPGGLSWPEYAAVVSYILQQNGYPAGEIELPTDIGRLTQIRIVPPTPPGDD